MAAISGNAGTPVQRREPGMVQRSAGTPLAIERGVSRAHWLKLLVYAEYGVGKTFLAGTSVEVPAMRDVIMINAESGDLTLSCEDYDFQSIDRIQAKDFRGVARAYDFLKLHCQYRDADDVEKLTQLEEKLTGAPLTGEPRRYRTVIIDSLSEVENYCMAQLLGVTDTVSLDEETAAAEWPEYKRNHNMVQRMVRSFRDLPMHVIMTCSRSFTQDETKKYLYGPAMTGKLSSQVQGFVDMVGYLVMGSSEGGEQPIRRLYVQPGARYAAKCRFSRFKGQYIENPSMKTIFEAIGLV